MHQESALWPFVFAVVIVRQKSLWTIFADGIVIYSESRKPVEERQERWRYALERRIMCVNERETGITVMVDEFKQQKFTRF